LPEKTYLGLDLSTQGVTAVVIEPANPELVRHRIDFDDRYPAYRTDGGVNVGQDPRVVHADPRMWLEALDEMCAWLKKRKLAERIRGIGVSAQQHGTVYLKSGAFQALAVADPALPWRQLLENRFSRSTSPVWMDSSTHRECAEINAALGGEEKVAALTGSIATERFAAPQIRKFWKEAPIDYEKTAHIALISSFITSVLLGKPAPVDSGDGFGMNLADIRTGRWSPAAMHATAPDLQRRLPVLLCGDEIVGNVSSYLVGRYGFDYRTEIVVGSGDNPCSLVGLGLIDNPQTHAISLGTSDTYFGYMQQAADEPRSSGHIFGTANGRSMFLICFKNGSLARRQLKDGFGLNWDEFSNVLLETPSGNHGRILLPYFLPEITPRVLDPGIRRFGDLAADDVRGNVRAIAEAQAMSMYRHSGWTGRRPDRILVTAGGAQNRGLLEVISQVFGTEVCVFELKESAALGAAVRAAHCCRNAQGTAVSWEESTAPYADITAADTIRPSKAAVEIYQHPNGLLGVYDACEKYFLGHGGHPNARIAAFKRQFPD